MNLLVSGATGQLGAGLFEAAAGEPWQGIVVVRPRGAQTAGDRARAASASSPETLRAAMAGDVTKPAWGLANYELERLAETVDAVVHLAGDTRWVAPERDLQAGNVVSAVHGYQLTERLQRLSDRPIQFVHASSIFVAPAQEIRVPEAPSPSHGGRTPYEHSKWMAERALLARARRPGAPPLVIARVAALIGSSTTGRTVRRNSLYLLADRWSRAPIGLLPLAAGARVDVLPRDVAARWLLQLTRSTVAEPQSEPLIVHVAGGDNAPATAALFEVARGLGSREGVAVPRPRTVPARALVWACENAHRAHTLPAGDRSALIGLRYVGLHRIFENERLAALVGHRPAPPSVETLARLVFGLDLEQPEVPSEARFGALARFVA